MAKLLMLSGLGALEVARGKHNAFYNTLSILREHFDRIDIISPGKKWSFSRPQTVRIFNNVYVHTSSVPLCLHWKWIVKKGKELHAEQKYDVITAHEYPPFYNGIGAYLLWGAIKVPYMIEIMHIEGLPRATGIKDSFYQWLTSFVIPRTSKHANAIRVINQKQVPNFLLSLGIAKSKLLYVPAFYIDFDIFKPSPNTRKKYDAIFVGRLANNKGIDLLLGAWKQLNYKLLIVGDGPRRAYIERSKSNNVTLFGYARDSVQIAELINESKMFIMPSYSEGGPRVALEAMACTVPVLATKVGIMADIVQDGENAVFIDWSAKDIAKKAHELLQNPESINRIGLAGHKTVQQFDQKSAIRQYAEAIKGLIK